jgi:hypothetical protein
MKLLTLAFVATLLPVVAASCTSSTGSSTATHCASAADCGHGNGPSQPPPYKWTCKGGGVCSPCTTDADCAAVDPLGALCLVDPHADVPNTCVECRADADCAALGAAGKIVTSSTHCENGSCGPCATDADCPGGHATCRHSGGATECRECVVDAECKDPAFPFCVGVGGALGVSYCGACRDYKGSADCTDPARPHCAPGAVFPFRVVCQAS